MGDFFSGVFNDLGDTVGALFSGIESLTNSNNTSNVNLSDGQVGMGFTRYSPSESSQAKFTDPRQIESEWTNRLFKFANMQKLVNQTKTEA